MADLPTSRVVILGFWLVLISFVSVSGCRQQSAEVGFESSPGASRGRGEKGASEESPKADIESLVLQGSEVDRDSLNRIADESPRLKRIRLSGAGIGDEEIAILVRRLESLELLHLADCENVTESAFDGLPGLLRLKEFSLVAAPSTGGGVLKWLAECPALVKVRLREVGLKDDDMLAYADRLPQSIRSLELSHNAIGDLAVAQLSGVSQLVDLNLWRTQVSGECVRHLSGLSLKRLNLDDNPNVGDAGLEGLAELSDLEFLHLGKTQASDQALDFLLPLKKLAELRLNETATSIEKIEWLKSQLAGLTKIVVD